MFLIVALFAVFFFKFDIARLAVRAVESLLTLSVTAWKRSQRER